MTDAPARRAVSSLVVRHIIGLGINFAGTVAIARQLGPEAWGLYAIAYVLQIIVQGLIERGAIGYLIQRPAALAPAALGTTLLAQLVLGAAVAGLILASARPAAEHFGAPLLVILFAAVAASSLLYATRAVPLGVLERTLAYRRVAVVELSDIATFTVVALGGLALGLGLVSLAIATVARALVSTGGAWLLARTRPHVGLDRGALSQMARFGIPYATSNALAWLNGAAAPLLVGTFAGARELGLLQMAYMLIAYPQVLTGILGRVAFPLYAESGRLGQSAHAGVERATGDLMRSVGVATIAIAATSPLWVPLLFGAEWAEMSTVMLVIAPVLGVGTAFIFVTAALNARGHSTMALLPNLVFSALYWTLAILLVPRIGMLGIPLAYIGAVPAFMLYPALYRSRIGSLAIGRYLAEFVAISALVPLVAYAWLAGMDLPIAIAATAILLILARNTVAIARRVYR